jgi:hypothetical protein
MRKLAAVSAVALVILAQAGSYALAQDAASTTSEENELKLQKERLAVAKQELELEQLRDSIGTARLKTITDAIPGTTNTGATTMGDGAGKMESSALTAVALNGLASGIAAEARTAALNSSAEPVTFPESDPCKDFTELRDSSSTPAAAPADALPGEGAGGGSPATLASVAALGPAPVLLLAGDDPLTFAHYDQFRFRACTVRSQLIDATKKASTLVAANGDGKSREGGAGFVTALSVGSKLLQLLRTDWEVKGIAGTATEKALLAAVARAYVAQPGRPRGRLYWASQVSKLGGSRPVFGALTALETLDAEAQKAEAGLPKADAEKKSIAGLEKLKTLTPWQRKRLGTAKANVAASTKLAEARAAYAALVKSLAGKEGETTLPIGKVIEEAAAAQLLGPTGLALNLNLEAHGGGYYTRKSFIDSLGLGGPPAHVSGGAVVSFLAVRPADLQVMGAGLVTCNAGYVKLSRVALRTNSAASGRAAPCPTERRR